MCCIILTHTGIFCDLQAYYKIILFAIKISPFSQTMKTVGNNLIKILAGFKGRKGKEGKSN